VELDLARIYDDHAQRLFAFLLTLTRREDDTREILQELFIRLARQPEIMAGVRDERAFLLRLAHNLAVDTVRRRAARQRGQERVRDQATELFAGCEDPDLATFQDALTRALSDLPVEQRAVVQLKLWAGLTFGQIADALEISPNTAASRYRYAIDKLRGQLRPLYDEIR
jgi:RNA polymerase sigma-70 factor (ECF subfamily)